MPLSSFGRSARASDFLVLRPFFWCSCLLFCLLAVECHAGKIFADARDRIRSGSNSAHGVWVKVVDHSGIPVRPGVLAHSQWARHGHARDGPFETTFSANSKLLSNGRRESDGPDICFVASHVGCRIRTQPELLKRCENSCSRCAVDFGLANFKIKALPHDR